MTNTSTQTSSKLSAPLASLKWLKYLGIVSLVLCAYVVVLFFYRYGDDVFPKSLTVGQYIQISLYSIGSMITEVMIPLLFFSGALLYRSVRKKGMSPLSSVLHDFVVIIPLGIALWLYGAYFDEPVKRNFYSMVFDVQQLDLGEKFVQNSYTYELLKMPNLNDFHTKIDTLNIQIKEAEVRRTAQTNNRSAIGSYIESLENQKQRYQDEISLIHLTPIYAVLFLLLGMILGYLIKLHVAASTAILIIIGYAWLKGTDLLQLMLEVDFSNKSSLLLYKIGILVLLNLVLVFIANKVYQRSNTQHKTHDSI